MSCLIHCTCTLIICLAIVHSQDAIGASRRLQEDATKEDSKLTDLIHIIIYSSCIATPITAVINLCIHVLPSLIFYCMFKYRI